MLSSQAHRFDLGSEITYINCAYMSPLAHSVAEAGRRGVEEKVRPYEITTESFFEPVRQLRGQFARLIGCEEPNRIAVVPAVSYGMATVARNLDIQRGQNLVILEEQFPSNYYAWQRLAEDRGAEIRTVAPPSDGPDRGTAWNTRLLEAIDEQTALVAVAHVHWADGTLYDLVRLRERTSEVGAALVIDGTQSVGALPFDVKEIRPDALICAAYKWLLGGYGSGLAYYGPRFDGGVPIEENWINRLDSHNFSNLVRYQSDYQPLAQRYNTGETSNFIAVAMLNAALELLHEWTPAGIQAYCAGLVCEPIDRLRTQGYEVAPPDQRGAHLFGVRPPAGTDMEALRRRLTDRKISVSVRGTAIRVSPHVYNTADDLHRLIDCLAG